MFWADRLAKEIEERYGREKNLLIRDEKTVSGRVHVGSMRGVAIHGAVHESLTEQGIPNTFIWEHNDFDPMDDIPVYLEREKYEQYLGMPLCSIPSPEPGAKNYGEFFAHEFQNVIEDAGFHPEFRWTSELYQSGKMDDIIRESLEHADEIRLIQKEISGAERKEGWLPISVICPTCGKMTTTDASDFDGETVHVRCLEKKVEYTKGCGFEGRVSPFGGNSKLYWKVDWPAKWKVYDVKVEGAGKDHATKGGSRDVGNHISKEVFSYEPPFDMPYEFFLVGGKKMSSSKGRGSSARDIAELLPPKIFRLALLSKDINQAINFDPEGDTIPILYDLYDKLGESYKQGIKDDYARLFLFSHLPEKRKDLHVPFLPRFSQIAFLVQMPHLNMEGELEKIKGAPLTDDDIEEIAERAAYAKKWLSLYAPEKFVFALQSEFPEIATEINPEQKKALSELRAFITNNVDATGEEIHKELHDIKDRLEIEPQKLFSAIYVAFLGKPYGPQAGWFLGALPRDFVLKRLEEASNS